MTPPSDKRGKRGAPGERDDGATHESPLPATSPDDELTGHVADVGVTAELRAVLSNGERKSMPLYTLADQIVVGRGTACEWQLDDASLSRKHAQLKWSGRTLTVEDLGSANGTRVGGRPARTALLAKPGEAIQLGTVIVTLELRQAGVDADAESTRLVATPEAQVGRPSPSAFPHLPGLATVVRPPAVARGSAAPRAAAEVAQATTEVAPLAAQLFHPSRDAARPDEATRPWDPRAALVRAPMKALDGELTERLKEAWRTNRRPFVLAGAALWIGALLTLWYVHDRAATDEEVPTAAAPHDTGPKVTSLSPALGSVPAPSVNTADAPNGAPLDESAREEQLEQAVAAYDQGRLDEALGQFRRLAADPRQEAARFMVDLIAARLAQGAPQ